MPDLEQERAALLKADQAIADGERRVTEQKIRIRQLIARGEDTTDALETLRILRESLEIWREHRQSIVDTIARLTARSG
jgi:outer membrane protein TolC